MPVDQLPLLGFCPYEALTLSPMVVLTEHLVNRRPESIADLIKNLNVWGSDLTDVGIVRYMPNIQVLSLSVNKIASLRDFGLCPRLMELYLRKNEVSDLYELEHLQGLGHLRVLWLSENPIAEHYNYRLAAIACVPSLVRFCRHVRFISPLCSNTRGWCVLGKAG